MKPDHFEATFRLQVDRALAWRRLTERIGDGDQASGWLPGFDSDVTILGVDEGHRLQARKDDEPCAGTDIVVTLEDDETGTRIHVVQSRFGAWLPARYDLMSVGWRFIVADLQLFLATGAHGQRHLQPWGDIGADVAARDGAVRLTELRPSGLADRLGMQSGDLLVALAEAPVASLDDLVTALRVARPEDRPISAAWVRDGALMAASAGTRSGSATTTD